MKFVIADDDLVVRHILSAILEGQGEILQCASGEECLYVFEVGDADFLFLDIQLPDISGPEVLGRLRKLGRSVRVIAVSANPEEEMREIFGPLPPDRFLEKPFTPEQVLGVIDELARKE